jgi:hypothetical protein
MSRVRVVANGLRSMPAPLWGCALLVLTGAMLWFRHGPWRPAVWYGDDLINFLAHVDGNYAAGPWHAVSSAFLLKYRPIFALFIEACFDAFDTRLTGYFALGLLLHGVGALLFSRIVWLISGRRAGLSALAALAFASSRFGLYQVTQVTGLVEGLALVQALGILVLVLDQGDGSPLSMPKTALLFSLVFGVVHTHERYAVFLFWLVAFLWLWPELRPLPRLRLTAFLVLVLAWNAWMRVHVLDMPYFMGTGGKVMAFSPASFFDRLTQGVLSITGLHSGPSYLSAWPFYRMGMPAVLACHLTFLAFWVGTLIALPQLFIQRRCADVRQLAVRLLLLALLLGMLLAPAAATQRMEHRWLMFPQLLVWMMLAVCIEAARPVSFQRKLLWWSVSMLSANIIVDQVVSTRFGNLYFVYSEQAARQVVNDYREGKLPSSGVIHLQLSPDHCNWSLSSGDIFRIYAGHKIEVACDPVP